MLGAWLLVQLHRSGPSLSAGGVPRGEVQSSVEAALSTAMEKPSLFDDLRLTQLVGRGVVHAFSGTRGRIFGESSRKNVELWKFLGVSRSFTGVIGASGSCQPLFML